MCYERIREGPKPQAFTPILFIIYETDPKRKHVPDLAQHLCAASDEIQRMPQNTSIYPDLAHHLYAATGRDLEKALKHERLPDLVQHQCAARDLEKAPKRKHLLDLVQHLCAARDWRRPQSICVYPDLEM